MTIKSTNESKALRRLVKRKNNQFSFCRPKKYLQLLATCPFTLSGQVVVDLATVAQEQLVRGALRAHKASPNLNCETESELTKFLDELN